MTTPDDPKDGTPEEAEGGTLAMDPELEAALREATESVEARAAERQAAAHSGAPAEVTSEELESLRTRLVEVEAENEALQDRLVRLQADFENHRRRGLKERQDALHYGHENLVKDLLGTVDNLERAIDHASQSDGGDLEGLLQGVELVQRDLLGTLNQHSVNEIEAAERPFDPNVHEAMAQVEDSERPAGTVVQVLQKGYLLRDRLLRPARVMVSKAPANSSPEAADEASAGDGEAD